MISPRDASLVAGLRPFGFAQVRFRLDSQGGGVVVQFGLLHELVILSVAVFQA